MGTFSEGDWHCHADMPVLHLIGLGAIAKVLAGIVPVLDTDFVLAPDDLGDFLKADSGRGLLCDDRCDLFLSAILPT